MVKNFEGTKRVQKQYDNIFKVNRGNDYASGSTKSDKADWNENGAHQ